MTPPNSSIPSTPRRLRLTALAALTLALAAAPAAAQRTADPATVARVDAAFARFAATDAPGCAVGLHGPGGLSLERAYGMAELEHGVHNTPGTIFEAGSVSKQLTAAAVVLLARDGKISLSDDVRKYFPELPSYGAPITIRHLLNHTSGLRDWGSVAAIGGWPRGRRAYTHEHVLDIASRQRALNYAPGEHYSYTNTGFNLLAMLVERVSGTPFREFSRERIFEPLGMKDTQWRDDFTRLVPGRATAYSTVRGGGWRLDMPFENVHGNGGLLTTVGDLLRWTEALESGTLGGAEFVREMHRQATLNGGRTIEYASGLFVTSHRGLPEVSHSGATAGYRAFLARYPERDLAVAVLCNAGSANATALAHEVADLFLEGGAADEMPRPVAVEPAVLEAKAGLYRDTRVGQAVRLAFEEGALRVAGGPRLVPLSATRFKPAPGITLQFDEKAPGGGRAGFLFLSADGDTVRYEAVPDFAPTPAQLAEYAGTYRSEEAEHAFHVVVEDGSLVLTDRYGERIPLRAAWPDAFNAGNGVFRFVRDPAGRVTEMSVSESRVWDLRFQRQPENPAAR